MRAIIVSIIMIAGLLATPALAQPLSVGDVFDLSSDNPTNPNRTFLTESTMSPVTGGGGMYSVTHRMAALNEHIGTGGVAQTNKRSIVFRFDVTVTDLGNVGYEVELESLLRGVSYINQTVGTSQAFATGVSLDVRWGFNLSDPSDLTSYTNLPPPIYGMSTASANVTGIGETDVLGERFESAMLPGGVYTGTNTFSFYITTVTTPTTNVLFQNGHEGSGFVNYGLGSDVRGYSVSPEDLGHFFTINVMFVPGPAGLALLGLCGLRRSRRRRG